MGRSGKRLLNQAARGIRLGVANQTSPQARLAPPSLTAESVEGLGAGSVLTGRKYTGAASGGIHDERACESAISAVWGLPGRAPFARQQTAVVASLHGGFCRAGMHVGRVVEFPPESKTYGVGPTMGAERDPQSKGSTPDDFRADLVHMTEPKEITKEKAAVAQQEPPDFQVQKIAAEREEPTRNEAVAQKDSTEQVFEPKTRKVTGTAEKQGDISSQKSDKVEASYGKSMPVDDDEIGTGTSRS